MLPGNPQILTCPYCGKEKEIMSLVSGNTIGTELWSDGKRISPMLPEISYVQKCPHCGKYFIMNRQEVRYAEDGFSMEQGLLTYPEMKEAFKQISEEGFQNKQEESTLHLMLHFAFNDYYYRTDEHHTVDGADYEQFKENVKWIIKNVITDNLMKAEYYREIGDFEKARSILSGENADGNEFLQSIIDAISSRIEQKNNKVFKIY